jgi:hypothetical protein
VELFSDRRVLLNWLPLLCSGNERGAESLLYQIPPECLGKDLWLELLAKERNTHRSYGFPNYLTYMPQSLRQDHEVVGAQLRCCMSMRNDTGFRVVYINLSIELQLQLVHLLVESIQNSSSFSFQLAWENRLRPELLSLPEVARAAIAKGWGPAFFRFSGDVVASSPWSRAPEFLLSAMRGNASLSRFCTHLPEAVRRDKTFVLRALAVDNEVRRVLDDDLLEDFDVRCAVVIVNSERVVGFKPSARDVELACEARELLGRYIGLENLYDGRPEIPAAHGPTPGPAQPGSAPEPGRVHGPSPPGMFPGVPGRPHDGLPSLDPSEGFQRRHQVRVLIRGHGARRSKHMSVPYVSLGAVSVSKEWQASTCGSVKSNLASRVGVDASRCCHG